MPIRNADAERTWWVAGYGGRFLDGRRADVELAIMLIAGARACLLARGVDVASV